MGAVAIDCVRGLQDRHQDLPQSEAVIPRLIEERDLLFRQVLNEKGVRPMPGVQAFLHHCVEHHIPIAMATSATRENTIMELKAVGWSHLFNVILTADDVTHPKPAPDIYIQAALQLGVKPEQCLAFEDGMRGLESAHAAGIPVVFVRDLRFGIEPPPFIEMTVPSFESLLSFGK